MKTTIKTITINQIFFTIQWRYHGYHPGGVVDELQLLGRLRMWLLNQATKR